MLCGLAALGAAAGLAWFGPAMVLAKAWHYAASRPALIFSADTGLYVAGMGVVMAVELAVLGWRASSLRRLLHPSASTWADLFLWGAKVAGCAGLLASIFSLGLVDLALRALHAVPFGVPLGFHHPLLQTLFVLLAMDFARYVMHIAQHKLPWWWEGHKFHHAAREFNVITTARGHPTDLALQLVFLAVPAALLGGSMDQFLFLTLLLDVHAGLTHSMLDWDFGWLGRWVLVSPIMHRIHHSDLPEHFDRNYASIFVFWDRIFGTFYTGGVVNTRLDVRDNPYNRAPLWQDLLECPRRMLRAALGLKNGAARQD